MSSHWRGILDTTLCDKICQWLVAGRLFSKGTLAFSTNKTDHHNITDILLKVALNTVSLSLTEIEIFHWLIFWLCVWSLKNKKYHIVGTVPKANRKIIETDNDEIGLYLYNNLLTMYYFSETSL